MEITGNLKLIGETKTFGNNGFKKRDVVITTDEQYPQPILVEFVQDKTDLLNSFKIGDSATISINLRGREWINPEGEAKYFNSIQGWRIAKNDSSTPSTTPAEAFETTASVSNKEKDDLPF